MRDVCGRIIRAAMALEGSYESSLLRIIVGYLHVSVLQQLALTRHGKAFHTLTPEEKMNLEMEMMNTVGQIAHGLTEESLRGDWKPPSGTVH